MKKIFLLPFVIFAFVFTTAQDNKQLHETGKTFLRQGDYSNAILVLNRALQSDPKNAAIIKDLALSYYLQKDNGKALETIKLLLDRDDADDQAYQIAGNIYKQSDEPKEAEKIYKKALKKFPDNGPLYNDLGELLWSQKNFEAIKQWEKGIEQDPSYSKNYYNASRYYFLTTDKVWSILYGEIFVNMEPLSSRTPEIKQILLDSYKKIYTDADMEQGNKDKNAFVKKYLQGMNKQMPIAETGINAESLSMIRTRFILNWYNDKTNAKYPYRLFEQQQQLLREGLFEAYNQWLFGASQNLSAYQSWINMHAREAESFSKFQSGRIFKIPSGQYYK
ncbi:MAG: tetratricopeptide repeat protein [Ferruginibacter sp.]